MRVYIYACELQLLVKTSLTSADSSDGPKTGSAVFRASGRHRARSPAADAEIYVVTAGQGRRVLEWRPKPSKPACGERGRTDNHWFDCLVGCAVAASMAGVKVPGEAVADQQPKQFTQDDLRRTDTWPTS